MPSAPPYSPFASEGTAPRFIPLPPVSPSTLKHLEWGGNRRPRPKQPPTSAPSTNQPPSSSSGAPVSLRSEPVPNGAQHGQRQRNQNQNQQEQPNSVVREVVREVIAERLTMMGVPAPFDDRIRHIVNFVLEHVSTQNVEVEAKIGLLIEKNENRRAVQLVPVTCETPISADSNRETRFESDVGQTHFYRLMTNLNQRVQESQGDRKPLTPHSISEVDVYWPGRIRETKRKVSAANGEVSWQTVKIESKQRLGDLNILCPDRWCDMRVSASVEQECQLPSNSHPTMQRVKNRTSYRYDDISIDFTTVEMENQKGVERSFEVEVEIVPEANLAHEVVKYRNGDSTSRVFDLATSMVHTVRALLEM